MDSIKQYDKPDPKDRLDEGTNPEEEVDQMLARRNWDRSTEQTVGPASLATSMEVQNQETTADEHVLSAYDDEEDNSGETDAGTSGSV